MKDQAHRYRRKKKLSVTQGHFWVLCSSLCLYICRGTHAVFLTNLHPYMVVYCYIQETFKERKKKKRERFDASKERKIKQTNNNTE